MAPLGPTAFAPLPLPAAFEFEWTPILSCNFLCLFSNSTPSFLHGLNQLGVATEGEIGCRFECKATGRLPELALPGCKEVRLLSLSFVSCSVPIDCLS